jgi:hypothetical protein
MNHAAPKAAIYHGALMSISTVLAYEKEIVGAREHNTASGKMNGSPMKARKH